MGDGLTVLAPVQKGTIWRVRIAWPNGLVHHFGKFTSEKDAGDWITARPWLLERPTFPESRAADPTVQSRFRSENRGRRLKVQRLDPARGIST
jgi:hypothetical protein